MTGDLNSPQSTDMKSDEPNLAKSLQTILGLLVSLSIVLSVIGFLYTYILVTRQTGIVSFESNPIENLVFGFTIVLLTSIKYSTAIAIVLALLFLALTINSFQLYRKRKPPLTLDLILNLFWSNLLGLILFWMVLKG